MIPRLALFATTVSIGVIAVGGTALAHIHPDPSQAQAGDTVTVGFTVEHGCDGSPTVEIEMRLADGIVEATPEPLDGWDESIDQEDDGSVVVTFTGGPLDPDSEGTFEITMTLPPTPDSTIYFPFVQHCEVGEIRWIGIPDESGDDLDEPAPAMDLIGPVVTTTAPPATQPVATVPDSTPDTVPNVDTTAPSEVTTPDTSAIGSAPTSAPASTDTDGSSDTGTIIFIVSLIAVFLVGGAAWLAARRARAAKEQTDDSEDAPDDQSANDPPTDGAE